MSTTITPTTTQTTQGPYATTTRAPGRPAYWAIALGVLLVAAAIYFFTRDNAARPVGSNAAATQTEQVRDVTAPAAIAPGTTVTTPEVNRTTPTTTD